MMIVTHTGDYTNNNDDYQVGTVTKMRDRMTASPPVLSPQPSAEQVIIIWILITLIILITLTILIKITLIKAGVMRRLRGSRDPWEQLGVARGANREEVLIISTIINVRILLIVFFL